MVDLRPVAEGESEFHHVLACNADAVRRVKLKLKMPFPPETSDPSSLTWRVPSEHECEIDELLSTVMKFYMQLREVKRGDFVLYREGSVSEGQIGVGKVTYVARYGRNHLTIHRYGMCDIGAQPPLDERIKGIYRPRHVTAKEGLHRTVGPTTAAPDEIRIRRADVIICSFQLTPTNTLPLRVQRLARLNAHMKLSWYADQLHRALTSGVYVTSVSLNWTGEQTKLLRYEHRNESIHSYIVTGDDTLNTIYQERRDTLT